jgi:hypothetical protein
VAIVREERNDARKGAVERTMALAPRSDLIAPLPVILIVIVLVVGAVLARRRGYGIGGETIVRCSRNHLFTTLWVPGASFKAVRLGTKRFQRCPVGRHWSLVTPVRAEDLTEEQRQTAAAVHDIRVP